MSTTHDEMKDELVNAIDNLRDCFEDFDFATAQGLSSSDLDGIEGFEQFSLTDDEVIPFSKFCKLIKHDFYSQEDDLKKSDFDWENLENNYEDVKEKYQSYRDFLEQVEENLTGDLTIETVEVMSEDDLKQALFELMQAQGMVYEVIHKEKGVFYVLNSSLQKQLWLRISVNVLY